MPGRISPRISIIIPCFNRERFIASAIGSALSQSYANKEIIVIDDGSTDSSWSIIASYGNDVTAIKTKNNGVSAARNTGISAATGEFIVLLDSDDRLEPDALLSYTDIDDMDPKQVRMGKFRVIDESERPSSERIYDFAYYRDYEQLSALEILSDWASNCACLIPKSLIVAAGGYNESLSLGEDYELNFRMLQAGGKFLSIGKTTYQVRIHNDHKLTRKVPKERYEQQYQNFNAVWGSYETCFRAPENAEHRIRLARWVWSVGRTCFRADIRDTGECYIELATRIAGEEARNGSAPVRLAYLLFSPYIVERLLEFARKLRIS